MTSTNAYRRGVGYYKDLNEKELDAAQDLIINLNKVSTLDRK